MRVAIATRFGGDPQDFVRRFPDVDFVVIGDDQQLPPLDGVEAAIGGPNPERFRQILRAAPRLRWFHTISAGVDPLLIPELFQHDVVLTNNTGSYDVPIAEFVVAMMFAAAKRLPDHLGNQRAHRWREGATPQHVELRDAVLVIVGMGSIGTELARLARALGMRVIGVRRSARQDHSVERLVTPDRLAEVCGEADYLAVTAALTDQTRGLVSRQVIAAMKPTAWLVNIARGPIVDEGALLEALQEHRIAGAAIDAWWAEPLPADSPWWDLDNVIVTPHRSNSSPRLRERSLTLFGENLRRFQRGEPLLNIVDKQLGY
ncbi:MAG: D-2-hydroxyacid dehydrogenase [Chloroflexi bacterium]|nr:MAG: D-2-hydroxyacid dehydrogenase [Chloroflexota bacterium]